MQDNNPTPPQPPAAPSPPPQATPQQPASPPPDPMTVLAPVSTSDLPDPGSGFHKAGLVILAVLLVTAVGIAVWQFVPLPQSRTPEPTATLNTDQIDTTLTQVDSAFNDLDANMAGIDPALSDVQGSLSE